jgi:hypothetical protein
MQSKYHKTKACVWEVFLPSRQIDPVTLMKLAVTNVLCNFVNATGLHLHCIILSSINISKYIWYFVHLKS